MFNPNYPPFCCLSLIILISELNLILSLHKILFHKTLASTKFPQNPNLHKITNPSYFLLKPWISPSFVLSFICPKRKKGKKKQKSKKSPEIENLSCSSSSIPFIRSLTDQPTLSLFFPFPLCLHCKLHHPFPSVIDNTHSCNARSPTTDALLGLLLCPIEDKSSSPGSIEEKSSPTMIN